MRGSHIQCDESVNFPFQAFETMPNKDKWWGYSEMTKQILGSAGATPGFTDHQQGTANTKDSPVASSRDDLKAAFAAAFVNEPDRRDAMVVAVVPAYNEDRFIGSVVLKARLFVDQVIVVDDGSSDETAKVATGAGAEVIVHAVNEGKGRALETGFARALELGADIVVTLDGDGQHDPQDALAVIHPIQRGQADMVIGSRFRDAKNHIPIWRKAGQHALTLVTNVASGTSFSDSQSGFRAFSRQALETFSIRSKGFAIESEMQFWAREQNLRVVEAPISCLYVEESKRNPFRHGLQVLNGITELISQSRPLFFFGLSGLLIAMLGTAWWWWIVQTYYQKGELALGYALLATLLIILGVLAIFEGVTLHTLRRITDRLPPRPAATRSKDEPRVTVTSKPEFESLMNMQMTVEVR